FECSLFVSSSVTYICPVSALPPFLSISSSLDISFSVLLLVFVLCGLALLGVISLATWKLCWVPWRSEALSSSATALNPSRLDRERIRKVDQDYYSTQGHIMADDKLKGPGNFLEAAVKISHTSPDIPADVQLSMKDHLLRRTRIARQTTEPASSNRSHLPRQMHHVTSVDRGSDFLDVEDHSTCTAASLGRIQPELYKQSLQETEESSKNGAAKTCGKINFSLKYDYEGELLLVTILKAMDLPAKDLCGSSDPYVKIYLLPDRKCKFQTRVHRKTLNPIFDETFQFPVPYEQLTGRKLHLSVFDFDRFSRHDMIGEVILENLFEMSDLSRETSIWRDIQYESVDLGEIMFSLCYLPTAGRLTLTVIRCRNLKAMDITGYSDPYVKVSLICDGKRLKKKKTTIKKNTLNPTYNEAIIFDIPPENMEQVSLHISVMDYDLVGHNEVIGVNRVGSHAEGLGRDHWNEMLAYPRKPIAHWHPLLEQGRSLAFYSLASCLNVPVPL
uniref:C2 domain-containing protein n=1 Tax=Pygocentrus nattereri TaxID=42514 RepID=A0AAR2JKV3_PYGNA